MGFFGGRRNRSTGAYRSDSGAFPVRLEAEFSFFAVIGFLICTDRAGISALCLLACFMHELGHLAVMIAERKPPELIRLYGGGIHISGGSTSLPAVAAGPLTNLSLFAAGMFLSAYNREMELFAVVNLLTGAFNLLPLGELDGKLLLDRLLSVMFRPEIAFRVSAVTERAAAVIVIPAVIYLIAAGKLSISAFIFFFYIFAVEILEKI